MAKGSVRKKGKKWYYRFYVEDESGRQVQREFAGTESKSETEALLRKAMEDYEAKKFVAKSENATMGMLLDMWVEEELKPGNLSNGTVMSYQGTVNRIKQFPISNRKLKSVTADHLQSFMDQLSFGGANPDGTTAKPLSKGYLRLFSAVLQGAFRFAVFPKRMISFNPMQYVVWRGKKDDYELFSEDNGEVATIPTLTHEMYLKLEDFLKSKDNPALLPIQIAYYTGLRIGEVCGLTWQDVNLEKQYLTVRRSMRYNNARHKTEIEGLPNAGKSVRWTSVTPWLIFYAQPSSNSTKTALSMANCSALTTTSRLRKKTVHTMRSIRYRETRRFPRDTRRSPLYVLDRTERMKRQAPSVLCAREQAKR